MVAYDNPLKYNKIDYYPNRQKPGFANNFFIWIGQFIFAVQKKIVEQFKTKIMENVPVNAKECNKDIGITQRTVKVTQSICCAKLQKK